LSASVPQSGAAPSGGPLSSGQLNISQAERVIDARDGKQDDHLLVKISINDGIGGSDNFDNALARADGFGKLNPTNRIEKGPERWADTNEGAKALGKTTQQLKIVHDGDQLEVPVTKGLAQRYIVDNAPLDASSIAVAQKADPPANPGASS